jgi:tetratricopeptide (TPR) repeat protein
LIEEALPLYEQVAPSAEQAEAWLGYAFFLLYSGGRNEEAFPALNQALEIAEAAGATALIPRILAILAGDAWLHEQVEQGFAFLDQGWARAQDAVLSGQRPGSGRGRAPRSRPRQAGRPGGLMVGRNLGR